MKKEVKCKTCEKVFMKIPSKKWSGNCLNCANRLRILGKKRIANRYCEMCNKKIYQYNKNNLCKSCWVNNSLTIGYWTGKKRPDVSGENHYLWKKNRSDLKVYNDYNKDRGSPAHREWSRQVKNRDCWKCVISNDNCSGKVVAHHILSYKDYPELRYDINNGITLCQHHHPRKRDEEVKLSPYFQNLVAEMK